MRVFRGAPERLGTETQYTACLKKTQLMGRENKGMKTKQIQESLFPYGFSVPGTREGVCEKVFSKEHGRETCQYGGSHFLLKSTPHKS